MQKQKTLSEKGSSPQEFFLYLLMFLGLAFSAFGAGSVLYGYIDKFITDREFNLYIAYNQGFVKFGISAIVIAGPIFFGIARLITKRINKGLISLDSKIRKWLTYVVLFIASAILVGDLIALVVNFLSGDIASSFLLKVLVILVIAGGIFGYYFWDMRRSKPIANLNAIAGYSSLAFIFIVFLAGFFIIDSPSIARKKNIDSQKISSIQTADSSIQEYYLQTGKLPQNLNELSRTKFSINPRALGEIKYQPGSGSSYELCADFLLPSDPLQSYGESDPNLIWKHEAGFYCFQRTAIKAELPLMQK
jgi:hypothetical protein